MIISVNVSALWESSDLSSSGRKVLGIGGRRKEEVRGRSDEARAGPPLVLAAARPEPCLKKEHKQKERKEQDKLDKLVILRKAYQAVDMDT